MVGNGTLLNNMTTPLNPPANPPVTAEEHLTFAYNLVGLFFLVLLYRSGCAAGCRLLCKFVGVMILDALLFTIGADLGNSIWVTLAVLFVITAILRLAWDSWRTRHIQEQQKTVLQATDEFSDLSADFQKVFLVFGVQSMLFQYYCSSAVVKMSSLFQGDEVVEHKWAYFGPSVVVQLFVISQTDEAFDSSIWKTLWRCQGSVKIAGDEGHEAQSIEVGRVEVGARMIMAFLVKRIYAQMIVLTLPVVLLDANTGLDFVKDAFAVTFIASLCVKDGCTFEVDNGDVERPSSVSELAVVSS